MRIAIVTHTYLPKIGGRETYVAKLAENLSRLGEDVTVITSGPDQKVETGFDFTIIRLPSIEVRLSQTPMRLSYTIIPRLFSTLHSLGFDIVQAHDVEQLATDVAALSAYVKKKPLVLAITGLGPLRKPVSVLARLHNLTLGQLTIGSAKAIMVGSYAKKKELDVKDPQKIFVVPFHGTEIRGVRQGCEDERQIMAFGRLIPRKGFQVAIRALPHVLARYPDMRLVIVGPDEGFLYALKRLARDLNVVRSIDFVGAQRAQSYEQYLERAFAVLVPSLYESEPPLTLLDAMAKSKPIIASSTEGMSEVVVHEQNGLLFPLDDHVRLSEAIIRLRVDDSLRRRLADNAYGTARSFGWTSVASSVRDVYRWAISN